MLRSRQVSYVYAHNRQVDVVEELAVVLDRHAGREEHHHLLLAVLLQEGEQKEQSLFRRANYVTLKKNDQKGDKFEYRSSRLIRINDSPLFLNAVTHAWAECKIVLPPFRNFVTNEISTI